MPERIRQAVMEAIGAIRKTFTEAPTLFYTENDLVCWFCAELNRRLPAEFLTVTGGDNLPHRLVHTEYPTPFRCDMANGGFRPTRDDEPTPRGGLYRRGHLDIVVLNPAFVANHDYQLLNAQDYAAFRAGVLDAEQNHESLLLFALEFYFSRKVIAPRGRAAIARAAARCARHIVQDANKLAASLAYPGFVGQTRHLSFVKGASAPVQQAIGTELLNQSDIEVIFGD